MASLTDSSPQPVADRPARAGLGPLRRGLREVGLALITLGVILLLFVGYQLFGTNITEARDQHALARQFSADVARAGVPSATAAGPGAAGPTLAPSGTPGPSGTAAAGPALPSVPPGGALEHLVIPRIGLDKFVVEGTSENDLRRGPGHYLGTALPGQPGNVGIAGHRTTYGAPFFRLDELAPGDPVYLTDRTGRTWVYKVSRPPLVVSPGDVAVLDPTPFAQLTLTTCNPRFEATSRLVVFARLVGPPATATPVASPTTTPAPQSAQAPPTTVAAPAPTVPVRESLGQGRTGALAPTILYGALVVLGWIGTRIWINRTRRGHRLAAFVVGIGVCLVPLWFCFENAVLLLPQSI